MITPSSYATLVVFIISIFFVIHPIQISIRRFPRVHIPINLTTAPIIAIALLWAGQCLGPSMIRDGIVGTDGIKPYNILLLFISLAYMAITLDNTGILEAAAHWVRNKGGSNGRKVFFYFYVMVTLISVVVGNDPVILTGTAFLTYYIKALKLVPTSWLISEFAAANTASMVLFVGNPTNVVICEGFRINNVVYSAYTIFPFLACSIFGFIALFLQFRDNKYISRRLSTDDQKDPRQFIRDRPGAWVGAILLGCCLLVIIVVSFFGVDVWKISVPFALAKLVFDFGWDYYRYLKVKQLESEETNATELQSQTNIGSHPLPLEDSKNQNGHVDHQPRNLISSFQTPVSQTRYTWNSVVHYFKSHYPTFYAVLPRLPIALVPFAFSQFILIEALAHHGWIVKFAHWLDIASGRSIYPTIWIVGVMGVILCNISGTNIGATILLTKVARASTLPAHSLVAAALALAVASNIGAVSFTFSASLAGLLWKDILAQKEIPMKQGSFAFWNIIPIIVMTAVGLGVVCIEMAVLY